MHHACLKRSLIWSLGLSALAFCSASAMVASPARSARPTKVDFNHDIRPIFAENCFACHGPDEAKRKARLRLDLYDIAVQPAKSGAIAIVPGSADKSELIKSTTNQDDDERMPPVKTGKRLNPDELGLRRPA